MAGHTQAAAKPRCLLTRKLSGFTVPSKANEAAFEQAVEEVAGSRSDPLQVWLAAQLPVHLVHQQLSQPLEHLRMP